MPKTEINLPMANNKNVYKPHPTKRVWKKLLQTHLPSYIIILYCLEYNHLEESKSVCDCEATTSSSSQKQHEA